MILAYKFADDRDKIAALPFRERRNPWYERSELITDQFLLFRDGPLAAYYAPGLHPNFPPVISRVRRLFRPSWGVSFVVVVSC
jgi:hypothetical protein